MFSHSMPPRGSYASKFTEVLDKNDIVCVIDDFGDYYDGMRIKGRYRRHGTFEYVFSDGARRFAPIFVRSKDYDKYMIIAEELGASGGLNGDKQKGSLDI